MHSVSYCLLIWEFNPFTFSVNTDEKGPLPFHCFLYLFSYIFFLPSILPISAVTTLVQARYPHVLFVLLKWRLIFVPMLPPPLHSLHCTYQNSWIKVFEPQIRSNLLLLTDHTGPRRTQPPRRPADLTPAWPLPRSSLPQLPRRAPAAPASCLSERTKPGPPRGLCTCCRNPSPHGGLHSTTRLHCCSAHRDSVCPSHLTDGSNTVDSLVLLLSRHLSLCEIVYFLYSLSLSNEKISGQGSQGKGERELWKSLSTNS